MKSGKTSRLRTTGPTLGVIKANCRAAREEAAMSRRPMIEGRNFNFSGRTGDFRKRLNTSRFSTTSRGTTHSPSTNCQNPAAGSPNDVCSVRSMINVNYLGIDYPETLILSQTGNSITGVTLDTVSPASLFTIILCA